MKELLSKSELDQGIAEMARQITSKFGQRPLTIIGILTGSIVMLADAVEAASRTLKNPTHARLKGLVSEIVDDKFQNRQLDESPLTMRDLEKIKDSFLTILAGMFHARVEYPGEEKMQG